MLRFRPFLLSILALIVIFLASCSSPTGITQAPVYTPTQIEQIQRYQSGLLVLRDRMTDLNPLIQNQEWTDVRSLIHGPLGELRLRISNLTRNLLPEAQTKTSQAAKDLYGHLNRLDEAAQNADFAQAKQNYREVLSAFDAFLNLIPKV